ncbi:MAG: hypothetical protein KGL39_44185, partial [Patescibacteria group bacterium]|nr:hypothetical protein [Patescibacteria group bacterium]
LRRDELRVEGYKLSSASKTALIDNAVLLVEQHRVSFPAIQVLLSELEAYEYERTAAGTLRMNAPGGMHDDAVIAFALACWPLGHQATGHLSSEILEAMRTPAPQRTGMGGAGLLKRRF